MKHRILAIVAIVAMLSAFLVAPAGAATGSDPVGLPIRVDIDSRLKDLPAPAQPSAAEAAVAAVLGDTTTSQCFGDDTSLTITIPSFDPANVMSQDVVFFKETAPTATGMATLWVAWDFMSTAYGREDVITCDQLAYLQSKLDQIVATNVHYFGQYVERPAGNPNIDVMIYNIVDESYFDPEYPYYIAGFFWSSINDYFDQNMIFIDTLDWENRLGPDVLHPYLYEATVAHELTHLIANDWDDDEESWFEEGFTMLSEYLNGFGHSAGHVVYFLAYHRTSLTVWDGSLENYGASYLFQLYLLEQFGERTDGDYAWDNAWTQAMIHDPANGIEAVENQTGLDFNDLFDAWAMANYLDDPSLTSDTGLPLGYEEIGLTPFYSTAYGPWSIERSISDIYGATHKGNLPVSRYWGGYQSGTVEYPLGELPPYAAMYGTYKGMQPEMNIWLRGSNASGVAAHAGAMQVASGGGNLLTDRVLALDTPVGGTLTFWTWFDIEEEWDYGFVEVSTDGGMTWAPLAGSITRASINPNSSTAWANSLVGGAMSTDTAITGSSGGWVEATFELPAASDVLVRFAYYTDEATNGTGWFIDDVAVSGLTDDFEADADGWTLGGWSWTTGLFPNDWVAQYVNPVYVKGKFSYLDIGRMDAPFAMSSLYEYIFAEVNTQALNRDEATVMIANRPGDSPFAAGYRLFVDKFGILYY
ncbi:MAG: hypothetical protein GX601_18065 [Anaerolineales bacterium]|nr:hypothetical protein [Anaerolineales bacterium]